MNLPAELAAQRALPGDKVIGWKIASAAREQLLQKWPPRYSRAVADHVTLRAGVQPGSRLPSEVRGTILGRSDDGLGVEALVVSIAGSTRRPDGGTYHITWSLQDGRCANESNDVIARHGWTPIEPALVIELRPECF